MSALRRTAATPIRPSRADRQGWATYHHRNNSPAGDHRKEPQGTVFDDKNRCDPDQAPAVRTRQKQRHYWAVGALEQGRPRQLTGRRGASPLQEGQLERGGGVSRHADVHNAIDQLRAIERLRRDDIRIIPCVV